MERRLAVALHDVEPATFERCALIRDWLDDHGVSRVTLLVVPAPDLHPFDRRSPGLAAWLAERRDAGDAVAQQGFCNTSFAGLGVRDTRRAVDAGRRLMHLAGVEPRGFVAPAYAYTPALDLALARSFEWWAALRSVHRRAVGDQVTSTAVSLDSLVSPVRRFASRRRALDAKLLRLDIHPADIAGGRKVAALDEILRRSGDRVAITYDAL